MTEDELRRLRVEMARLQDALDAERRHAEQWRQVAEDRRVQLEKLRQHPVIALLFRIARVVLPPLRRSARRAGRWSRTARRRAAGVKGLRHQIDAPRRERRLLTQVAQLDHPPPSPRRVSIIIPTRDGRANLERLLPALAERTVHEHYEIIVVDNDSGPETAAWLDDRDEVVVIHNDANRSFSEANNQGVAVATGDTLLFLNDDIEPVSRGWLRRMLRALPAPGRLPPADTGEQAAGAAAVVAVGAQLVYPRRPLLAARTRDLGVQHLGTEYRPVAGSVPRAVNISRDDAVVEVGEHEVAAATAACLLVDRSAFEAAGGYDTRYHYGAEDVDLCWSLRRRGGIVVVATDAILFHHEGATRHRDDPAALQRRQRANWDEFAAKYGPEVTRAVARDRLTDRRLLSPDRFRIGITITRDLPEAGYGDWYTAHELGEALERLGWEVHYVERYRDAWYDLDDPHLRNLDAILVLLDVFDLRRVARPGLTTIAWVRNWTERWASHPWFDDYDLVLASSRTSADLLAAASRHRPVVFPLATNPQRFHPGEGSDTSAAAAPERSGAVFAGNYWGRDQRLADLVAAVPDLVVYGKGWDEIHGIGDNWRGHLPYDDLPAVYASALVVVDQAADHTRAYGSVNSRVFDALAAGSLPVTNQRAGAQELFGDDLPVYDDAAGLKALTDDLLADPAATARRAGALRRDVLAAHTYDARAETLRDLLLARVDRPSVALAISAPDRAVAPTWGDWHFAQALGRELRVRGHAVRILTADEWEATAARAWDVFVHLKGRSRAPRAEGQLHVIWNISHPEELTPEECDAADLVLVASHTGWDRELSARVSTPVEVLLQATDERRFRPRPAEARYDHDVAFVGNSRFVFRHGVAEALEAGLRPAIYGANWDRFVDPDLIRSTHIPNEDLPRLYSSVKVLLNDHWEGMRRHGFASNRLFDALACGCVVVSDHLDGLDDLFDGGVVTYRTPAGLRATIDRLVADEDERRERGERGRAAVLAAHTFAHRADELLAWIEPLHARRLRD